MILRSLVSTAALALVLGGPAAAFMLPPVPSAPPPLVLAQADSAEARLRAAEEELERAEAELEQAEEDLAEAERSGGDVEAARARLQAADEQRRVAEEELQTAEEELEAALEAAEEPAAETEGAEPSEPPVETEEAQPSEPPVEPQKAKPSEQPVQLDQAAPSDLPVELQQADPSGPPAQLQGAQPADPPVDLEQARPTEPPVETPPPGTQKSTSQEPEVRETERKAPSLFDRLQRNQPEASPPSGQQAAPERNEGQQDAAPDGQRGFEQQAQPRGPGQRRGGGPDRAEDLPERVPQGADVVRREGDRLIIQLGDQFIVRKDENDRMRRFGREVETEDLGGGLTRTVVTRPNGVQVITIRDEYGEIIRRVRRLPNGREVVLVDAREIERPPRLDWEARLPPLVIQIPREEYIVEMDRASQQDIHEALTAPPVEEVERVYTLQEVRQSERLRDKVRRVDLDTITFEFNSADIPRDQLPALATIGEALEEILDRNPEEVYLIEGHTDAVGSDLYNLALSDRRAESVAISLSENFDIPPENLVTQGYGEQYLKVPTEEQERENRRVTIRRITPLISSAR